MAEDKNLIGEAYVKYGADTTNLEQGAAKVEQTVAQTTEKVKAAATQTESAWTKSTESLAQGFRKTVGHISGFIGALGLVASAVAGAAVGLEKLWGWLTNVGINAEKAADKIRDPLIKEVENLLNVAGKLDNADLGIFNTEVIKQNVEDLKKLNEQIAKYETGTNRKSQDELRKSAAVGIDTEIYNAYVQRAEKTAQIANYKRAVDSAAEAKKAKDDADAVQKTVDELEKQRVAKLAASLDERERLVYQYQEDLKALDKQYDAEKSERVKAAIKALTDATSEAFSNNLDRLDKEDAKKAEEKKKREEDAIKDLESKVLPERQQIIYNAERDVADFKEEIGKTIDDEEIERLKRLILLRQQLRDKELADQTKKEDDARRDKEKEELDMQSRIMKEAASQAEELRNKARQQAQGYGLDDVIQSINAGNKNIVAAIRSAR